MYFGYLEPGPGQLSAIYLKKRRDGPKLCPHHKQSRAVILTTSQRPKLLNIYIKYKPEADDNHWFCIHCSFKSVPVPGPFIIY